MIWNRKYSLFLLLLQVVVLRSGLFPAAACWSVKGISSYSATGPEAVSHGTATQLPPTYTHKTTPHLSIQYLLSYYLSTCFCSTNQTTFDVWMYKKGVIVCYNFMMFIITALQTEITARLIVCKNAVPKKELCQRLGMSSLGTVNNTFYFVI